MIIIILAKLLVLALILFSALWVVRTRRYVQALLALLLLSGGITCIVGFTKLDVRNDGYLGVVLIAIGFSVLLGTAIAVKLLYFRGGKNAA